MVFWMDIYITSKEYYFINFVYFLIKVLFLPKGGASKTLQIYRVFKYTHESGWIENKLLYQLLWNYYFWFYLNLSYSNYSKIYNLRWIFLSSVARFTHAQFDSGTRSVIFCSAHFSMADEMVATSEDKNILPISATCTDSENKTSR